ncbi:galactokinase [Mycoplasmatota bacterium WC30]
MKQQVNALFIRKFHTEPEKLYFSPGRVNIIGGHTDYNGGAVLPFCINLGIYAAAKPRRDNQINIYSDNLPNMGVISFTLSNLKYNVKQSFANYASGFLHELLENGYKLNNGFDLVIIGNLPRGGGLSSSAALLLLIGNVINDFNQLGLSKTDMALISKSVENNYIGVNCGIMDQFIIANGLKNNIMYLESNTLYYEQIPFDMLSHKFVLVNSKVTRKLSLSKYNVRFRETQDVLKTLQKHVNINHICDLKPEDYNKYEKHIKLPELIRRFKHLVDENARVKQSVMALKTNDFDLLGNLITLAHASARDLYEISSEKLDNLVEMGMESGSLGSKMIGGGFGGSILNLVKTDELDKFIENFTDLYIKEYNTKPIINVVEVTGGTGEI